MYIITVKVNLCIIFGALPTLAVLAGVDESDFQSSGPNNIDLKAFGDQVTANKYTLEAILDMEIEQTQVAYVLHNEPNGTPGGNITNGAWVNRTANTLIDPEGIIADLSSDLITLDAGTWEMEGYMMCGPSTEDGKSRIRNLTDDVTVISGSNSENDTSTGSTTNFAGTFTIVSQKVFGFQIRLSVNSGTDDLGQARSFGEDENYMGVKITKRTKKTIREILGL